MIFYMKIKVFFFSMLLMFLFVTPVFSDFDISNMANKAADKAGYKTTSISETTLAETIGLVVKAALSMVGVIFLLLMVYAGYLWMTARGEEEMTKKAQKIIISSVIGLIIVVASYTVTNFIVFAILSKTVSSS